MTRAYMATSDHVSVGELGCAWRHARAIELSGYGPLPKAISVPIAIQRPGSGVVFMAAVATEGSVDAQGLISYQGLG